MEKVKEICDKYYIVYNTISKDMDDRPELVDKFIDLFINNSIDDELLTNDSTYMRYVGIYYKKVNKDYDQMKKYYLMAIEKGNSKAMNNLGSYYKNIEKDYDQMKKYYLMAIEKRNFTAMNNLGLFYKNIEKDYDQMKKYYIMAIEKGDPSVMNNLGVYYKNIEKDYDQMQKYYLMAIEKGNSTAMNNFRLYYNNDEKEYYHLFINLNEARKRTGNKVQLIIDELNKPEIKKYNRSYEFKEELIAYYYNPDNKYMKFQIERDINIEEYSFFQNDSLYQFQIDIKRETELRYGVSLDIFIKHWKAEIVFQEAKRAYREAEKTYQESFLSYNYLQ